MLNLEGLETDGVPMPSDIELAAADRRNHQIPPIDPTSHHSLPRGWQYHSGGSGYTYATAPDGRHYRREDDPFIPPAAERAWKRVNLDGVRSL